MKLANALSVFIEKAPEKTPISVNMTRRKSASVVRNKQQSDDAFQLGESAKASHLLNKTNRQQPYQLSERHS